MVLEPPWRFERLPPGAHGNLLDTGDLGTPEGLLFFLFHPPELQTGWLCKALFWVLHLTVQARRHLLFAPTMMAGYSKEVLRKTTCEYPDRTP